MENNNQNQDQAKDPLSALQPPEGWRPDTARALRRLRDQGDRPKRKGRRWAAVVAMAAITSLGVMAFPSSRAFAQRSTHEFALRCMDLCATGFSRESMMELHHWLIGSLLGFLHPGGAHVVTAKHEAKLAPDFTLTDASGNAVRLSDYKGKVVLLNFWATWCAPCREETPWFVDFQSKYRDRGFVVLGVSLDDDGWKSVKPFMETKHVNYPVMIGSEQVGDLYGVKNLPETFIIDRDGRIAANCTGLIGKDEYRTEIEAALKGGVL